MLFLIFEINGNTYAIDCTYVSRVLPFVRINPALNMPEMVAGLMNCMGKSVPVVDLTQVISNHPSEEKYNTRIVLFDYMSKQIGVILENFSETINCPLLDFIDMGVHLKEKPFLAGVKTVNGKEIKRINIEKLLQNLSKLVFSNNDLEVK